MGNTFTWDVSLKQSLVQKVWACLPNELSVAKKLQYITFRWVQFGFLFAEFEKSFPYNVCLTAAFETNWEKNPTQTFFIMLNFHYSCESYLLNDINWTTTLLKIMVETALFKLAHSYCWKIIQPLRYQDLQYLSFNINC